MKNPTRVYLVFLLIAAVTACASKPDAWRQAARAPVDTGSDHWWETVVKRGW